MNHKVIIILTSIIILVGITTLLLISRTKDQSQDSVNGLQGITISDINELDQYPEVKEFLVQNGNYEKLEQLFKDSQTRTGEGNKEKVDEENEAALTEKYGLEKPIQSKEKNFEVTILIEYGSNKAIKNVQLK